MRVVYEMKAIAINSSPRLKGNTAALLKSALNGAKAVGFSTELYQLSDYEYRGCRGCSACKIIKAKSYGKCVRKDGISELLETVTTADVLLLGTPMYFGQINGAMQKFLERMFYPYSIWEPYDASIWPKETRVGFFYTMNMSEAEFQKLDKIWTISPILAGFRRVCGDVEVQISYETMQFFEGYENYYAPKLNNQQRRRRFREEFPQELDNAYDLGKKLAFEAVNSEPDQRRRAYREEHWRWITEARAQFEVSKK